MMIQTESEAILLSQALVEYYARNKHIEGNCRLEIEYFYGHDDYVTEVHIYQDK